MSHFRRGRKFWQDFFMGMASTVASLSKDPRRKVGAVLTTPDRRQFSLGYNGFPASIEDRPEFLANRELKQQLMVHAEANALAQSPFNTNGCTIYVTRFPCEACAKHIVAANVYAVVAPVPDLEHPRWGKSWALAIKHLAMAGVRIEYTDPVQEEEG